MVGSRETGTSIRRKRPRCWEKILAFRASKTYPRRMPKPSAAKKSKADEKPAKNANPKGAKITKKTVRATEHKAPERRNENKVRGR